MRFNNHELAEFAVPAGDHEGRLTYKPPPKTLYDSAYKERWFKLRANCLFYYRLNENGAVEELKPMGVFVLENCEVKREEASDLPFGFTIQWKDDPEKKHMFFASSEDKVRSWVSKIVEASYENLRAKWIMLRVQIRKKTGRDPLEHYGTPLPQRASWSQELHQSFEGLHVSGIRSLSSPPHIQMSTSSSKSDSTSKSPRLFKRSPIPPPRKHKHLSNENGYPEESSHGDGKLKASFRSHVKDPTSDIVSSKGKTKSTFKSHISD